MEKYKMRESLTIPTLNLTYFTTGMQNEIKKKLYNQLTYVCTCGAHLKNTVSSEAHHKDSNQKEEQRHNKIANSTETNTQRAYSSVDSGVVERIYDSRHLT